MRRSLLALTLAFFAACASSDEAAQPRALEHRGQVAVYGDVKLPSDLEGTKLVRFAEVPGMVEAAASGSLEPVLEVIEGRGIDGLLVDDPDDPADIADKLLQLFAFPLEAEAMGRSGRRRVRDHFLILTEVRRWLEELDALLAAPRPTRSGG